MERFAVNSHATELKNLQLNRIEWTAGQKLSHSDLNANNRYFDYQIQRLQEVVGFGIVGEIFDLAFRVQTMRTKSDQSILVAPGLARDPWGHWLIHLQPTTLTCPEPQTDGIYVLLARYVETPHEHGFESGVELLVDHVMDSDEEMVAQCLHSHRGIEIARWPASASRLEVAANLLKPGAQNIDQRFALRLIPKVQLNYFQQQQIQEVAADLTNLYKSHRWLSTDVTQQFHQFAMLLNREATRDTWHRGWNRQVAMELASILERWLNMSGRPLPAEIKRCRTVLSAYADELCQPDAESGLLNAASFIELLQVVTEGLTMLPEFLDLEDAGEEDLDNAVSLAELQSAMELPEAVVIKGLVFDLLDMVVFGDEDSEHEHHLDIKSENDELSLISRDWDNGGSETRQGYQFESGHLSCQIPDLDPGLEAYLVYCVDGQQGMEKLVYQVNEEYENSLELSRLDASGWHNLPLVVEPAWQNGSTLNVKFEGVAGANCFGLAIYQQRP